MDLVLHTVDYYFLTPYVYSKDWPEDDPWRQLISLFLIASVGGYLLYFAMATISFYAVYDQRLLEHPQILRVSWTIVKKWHRCYISTIIVYNLTSLWLTFFIVLD